MDRDQVQSGIYRDRIHPFAYEVFHGRAFRSRCRRTIQHDSCRILCEQVYIFGRQRIILCRRLQRIIACLKILKIGHIPLEIVRILPFRFYGRGDFINVKYQRYGIQLIKGLVTVRRHGHRDRTGRTKIQYGIIRQPGHRRHRRHQQDSGQCSGHPPFPFPSFFRFSTLDHTYTSHWKVLSG